MHDIDARVAEIACRQHSLITLAQLVELGGNKQFAQRRVDSGRWRRVNRAVFVIAGHRFTWETKLMAAVLAAGEGAQASHRSAGVLWDIERFRPGRPELSVPPTPQAPTPRCPGT